HKAVQRRIDPAASDRVPNRCDPPPSRVGRPQQAEEIREINPFSQPAYSASPLEGVGVRPMMIVLKRHADMDQKANDAPGPTPSCDTPGGSLSPPAVAIEPHHQK